ncbi:VENN motif pre-toxin domain-containing protein, partial [Salinicola socius]
ATGGDFSTGAAAAGANEALVKQLDTLVANDPQLLVAASKLTGLMAAGLVDGDVAQGAEIAGNATAYNYLRHAQFQDIADRLEQCTTQSCRDQIVDQALTLSQQQDLAALQLCASGSSGCGDAVLASMTTPFEGVEFSKPETAASLRELMWENPGKNGAFAMAAANQDAATVVDALDPEDRLSPEQRAQAEETLAGVMSSGVIGGDRGGYTGVIGAKGPTPNNLNPSSALTGTEAGAPVNRSVIRPTLGTTRGEYSAVKPGPLADDLAVTFSGGAYKEVVLQNDTVLYRAGTSDRPLGQFFSQEKPDGIIQTRVDKAVLPVWPGGAKSPIDTSFSVRIPAGTKVYVGKVGVQEGFYVGGSEQIVVVKPWAIEGVNVLEARPLK